MKRTSTDMEEKKESQLSQARQKRRAIRQRGPQLTLSEEQDEVVNQIVDEHNVLCLAKAGSGKSTLALHAAYRFHRDHGQRALMITYNTRLKNETRARINKEGLKDCVECHSYHATAYKYFSKDYEHGADDGLINHALSKEPVGDINFGLVIIDEAQDMNDLYARFIQHLLKHMEPKPVMLIVGDPFQRIFGFNGACVDYLTRPSHFFGDFTREKSFRTRHLSICWRITHEMADYINESLNPCNLEHSFPEWWADNGKKVTAWWGKGIRAAPNRAPAPDSVEIIRGWGSRHAINKCKVMFRDYGNDEVALISYSLKNSRSPIYALVDKLGQKDSENWLILQGNGAGVSKETVTGKRVASTVHRFKGLERRGILVCGVDSFIERVMKSNPLDHFNVWYVACTRAKDKLIINVTGSDYATIRCSPKYKDIHYRTTCTLDKLVEYVPFDSTLSVHEQVFRTSEVFNLGSAVALDKKECLVPGREEGTMEDLQPFLERAVSLRLMVGIHGSVKALPPIFQTGGFDNDMMHFLQDFNKLDSVGWPDLVKYAIAYETYKTQYKHFWRQLKDFNQFTPELKKKLERSYENALSLLWKWAFQQGKVEDANDPETWKAQLKPLLEFEAPVMTDFKPTWYTDTFTPGLPGTLDIVFDQDQVIGLSCAETVEHEKCLQTQLGQSVLEIRQKKGDVRKNPLLLLACQSILQEIKLVLKPSLPNVTLNFELLQRAARRKLHLPFYQNQLDQDYREFMA